MTNLNDVLPRRALGERHPAAKLTVEKVREIRDLHARGASTMGLAKAFGVSAPTIRAILLGVTWKHVVEGA